MAKKKYILGIDVGGTSIKYGLVSASGKLIKFQEVLTPKTKTGILNTLYNIIDSHKNLIAEIGLGLPGRLDLKQGEIIQTPNIKLSGVPIVKLLKKRFGLPTKIDNDANCFTLAETIIGSGKKYQSVVGLTLGSGVGGGLVINKGIYHGRNNAGEFGHQFIDFFRKKDLESFIGARALKLSPQDYQRLEKQVVHKNPRAIKFWNKLGTALGFGCVNLINLFDPDIVILGGKQARAFKYFSPQLYKVVNQYCLVKPPKIVKSRLIDRAGVIGAALLFKKI